MPTQFSSLSLPLLLTQPPSCETASPGRHINVKQGDGEMPAATSLREKAFINFGWTGSSFIFSLLSQEELMRQHPGRCPYTKLTRKKGG